MAHLSPSMTLSVAGVTVPVASPNPELGVLMRSFGYEPADFNYLSWPIGASQFSDGRLLLHGDDLASIADVVGEAPATLTLKADDKTVTITGLVLRPPEPLLISGRGGGSTANNVAAPNLYSLPITDRRWTVRQRLATDSWNRVAFFETHVTGGTPVVDDQILLDLAEQASLPLSLGGAGGGWVPYEVHSKGDPAVRWIDEILAETGRVYIFGIDGLGTAALVDQTNVFATLLALSPFVQSGGTRFTATGISDHVADVAPGIEWVTREIPFDTRVVQHGSQDQTAEPLVVTPVYGAESIGLASALGDPITLHDNFPFVDELDPDTAEALSGRAEALATAFYRRYRAGGMKARLAGWHSPTLGGGCQRVTWRLWNGLPFTDIGADLDNPIFGFRRPNLDVTEGGNVRRVVRPSGRAQMTGGASASIDAVLTDATRLGGENKWRYDWRQVEAWSDGQYRTVADGLNSSTAGPAYNDTETIGESFLGSGIDMRELPGDFDAVPMFMPVVRLWPKRPAPGAPNQNPWWSFNGTAEIDGDC